MTNCSSPSHSDPDCLSIVWHDSQTIPRVRFATRRVSLARRIELTRRLRELTLRHEFLKAGVPADQLEASLSEMLVHQLLIEWGLVEITGLTVDGQPVEANDVVADAPEVLAQEIAAAVQHEIVLSEDERKNF